MIPMRFNKQHEVPQRRARSLRLYKSFTVMPFALTRHDIDFHVPTVGKF
jgi:hypothetical protein